MSDFCLKHHLYNFSLHQVDIIHVNISMQTCFPMTIQNCTNTRRQRETERERESDREGERIERRTQGEKKRKRGQDGGMRDCEREREGGGEKKIEREMDR